MTWRCRFRVSAATPFVSWMGFVSRSCDEVPRSTEEEKHTVGHLHGRANRVWKPLHESDPRNSGLDGQDRRLWLLPLLCWVWGVARDQQHSHQSPLGVKCSRWESPLFYLFEQLSIRGKICLGRLDVTKTFEIGVCHPESVKSQASKGGLGIVAYALWAVASIPHASGYKKDRRN